MIVILKPLSSEERLLRFFICCFKSKKLPYLNLRGQWDYKQNKKDLSISSSDDAKSWTKPVMAASQTNQRSLKQSVTNVTMIHLKRDGSRLFLRSGFSRIKKPRPFSYHRSQVRSFFSSSSSTFLTTRPMEWRRKKEGLTKNTSWLDKTGASRSKPCTCLEVLASFFFSTVEDQVSVAKGGRSGGPEFDSRRNSFSQKFVRKYLFAFPFHLSLFCCAVFFDQCRELFLFTGN